MAVGKSPASVEFRARGAFRSPSGAACLWGPDLHARNGGFHLLRGHLTQLLKEAPRVALRVDDPVGAVAVELVFRLLDDRSPGGTSALAVGVDSVLKPHADGLGVRAADRAWSLHVFPFTPDMELPVAKAHFRTHHVAIAVRCQHGRLEAEGLLKPLDRASAVRIGNARLERRLRGARSHDSSVR